ncbi:hypothetical protein [Streptomyces sp. NPDC046887]|uniref:hypothetical protein n=1 Tax=Streptomyces sp. NPDC046887 TaxID=3155472 RepID=UPI0033E7EC94
MVQVDAFWSYAIGAGCALATAEQLHGARDDAARLARVRDRHLLATVLFMGVLFTPMGMWLATRFPAWETMYAVRELPPWGMALFSAGTTLFSALGYCGTHALLVRGRVWPAFLQLLGAYTAVFFVLIHGWDGTGAHRFLAPAAADFPHGPPTASEFTHWLGSPVAATLLGMGLVLIPALLWSNARAHTAGARGCGSPAVRVRRLPGLRAVCQVLALILGPCLLAAVAASAAVTAAGVLLGGTAWGAAACVLLRPAGTLARTCRRIALPSVHAPSPTGPAPTAPRPAST